MQLNTIGQKVYIKLWFEIFGFLKKFLDYEMMQLNLKLYQMMKKELTNEYYLF